ncbi:MAG: D-alanyl-D-alanine carboxypeptidase family protein [Oscillospiraceae bacterium]|jgi:D-alanyl-D-alanine carboxypeptidase|nr:D-alanyl-D-alanine carboxypeptidase family protein [Oscillospiraceae bacterium]
MKRNQKNYYGLRTTAVWVVLLACLLGFAFLVKTAIGKTEQTGQETYSSVAPTKGDYQKLSLKKEDIHKGDLILVNAENKYQFSENREIVHVFDEKNSAYSVKDKNVAVAKNTMEALNRLLADFYDEQGNNKINVISGHRTYAFQQTLLDKKTEETGAVEAMKWVALPGASEHHTGLAVDLSIFNREDGSSEPYKGTGQYKWINENAYKYGFIVRYPDEKKEITGIDYEPWHFRYLGLPHSYLVTEKKLCYEEYIDFLRQFEYDKEHLQVSYDGKSYEIYFTGGTDVYVPKSEQYSISGNNVDGFIVTVVKNS